MTKYRICQDTNKADLQAKIVDLIEKGWEPVGGVAVMQDGPTKTFYQAMMTKKEASP